MKFCKTTVCAFLFLFIATESLCQIKFNVSSPYASNINIKKHKNEIKNTFKKLKRDSIKSIERKIESIENQIEELENHELSTIDSLSFSNALDSLKNTLDQNQLVSEELKRKADSIYQLKKIINWDSLEDEFIAEKMKSYLQSEGHIAKLPESGDPVGEFKQSLNRDLPTMHLDPESFKDKEALSKEAAKHLGRLKSKYIKVNDLRYPEVGSIEKPKPYTNFTDRIIFGGQFNLVLSKNPTLDVKPNIGLMVSKRVRIMTDFSSRYLLAPKVVFLEKDEQQKQRIGLLLDVDVTKGFFVRGKAEKFINAPVNSAKDFDYFLGVGKTLTLYKGLKAQVVFSHSFTPNDKGKRWFLEYGIQQQGISNLFKKKSKNPTE